MRLWIALIIGCLTASADMPAFRLGTPPSKMTAAAYSPDGKYLALGGPDLLLFDRATKQRIGLLNPNGQSVSALSFSADSTKLAVEYLQFDPPAEGTNIAHRLAVLSIPDGKELASFPGLDTGYNQHRRIALSPDSTQLASSDATSIKVFDVATGEMVWDYIFDRSLNPTGSYGAFDVTPDWSFFLFNLERISYPAKDVSRKARWSDENRIFYWSNIISPDGQKALAVGGPNGSVQKLFDLETGELLKTCEAGINTYVAVADATFTTFYMNNGWWNSETGETCKGRPITNLNAASAKSMALDPEGQELIFYTQSLALADYAEGSNQEKLYSWLPISFANVYPLPSFSEDNLIHARGRKALDLDQQAWVEVESSNRRSWGSNQPPGFNYQAKAFAPDGKVAASNAGDLLYPQDSGKAPQPFLTEKERGVPLFTDNEHVFHRTKDKVYLYDTAANKLTTLATEPVFSMEMKLSLSPDKRWITAVEGSWGTWEKQRIAVYDAATGQTVMEQRISPNGGIAFNHDASQAAVWSGKKAWTYHAQNWKVARELSVETGRLAGISYSPNAKWLLLANENRLSEVRDAATGELRFYLLYHELHKQALAAPDGTLIDQNGGLTTLLWNEGSR